VAQPCVKTFGPVAQAAATYVVQMYVGLKFDAELVKEMKEAGRSVNLTLPVQDFMSMLDRDSYPEPEHNLQVKVVKRKELPQWVKDQYYSAWKDCAPKLESAPPTPATGAAHVMFNDSLNAAADTGGGAGTKRKAEEEGGQNGASAASGKTDFPCLNFSAIISALLCLALLCSNTQN